MPAPPQCCFVLENDPKNREKINRVMEKLGFHIVQCHGAFVCENCPYEPDLVIVGQDCDIPDITESLSQVELLIRETQAPVLTPPQHKQQLLMHFENVQVYLDENLLGEMAWSLFSSHLKRRTLRNELVKAVSAIQYIEDGAFHFQTLEEAQALAMLLATLAPHKKLLRLGLSELFINAVEHGNLGISSDEKLVLKNEGRWLAEIDRRLAEDAYKDKKVSLNVLRDSHRFTLILEDQGDGFDWQKRLNDQTVGAVGFAKAGRGIAIAQKAGLDELNFMGRGNKLKCAFSLGDVG